MWHDHVPSCTIIYCHLARFPDIYGLGWPLYLDQPKLLEMDVSNMLYISFQEDLWSIRLWGQKKVQFCGIGTNLSRSSGPSCQVLSYTMQYQKSRKGRFWVNTPQLFIVITYHHLPSLTYVRPGCSMHFVFTNSSENKHFITSKSAPKPYHLAHKMMLKTAIWEDVCWDIITSNMS